MTTLTLLPDAATPLDGQTAEAAFADILDGKIADADVARFLVTMAERDETAVEIAAAARVMRARMIPVAAPAGAIDVCGTGGDGAGTLNVSTAVTFVLAGLEVPVAKHGNRALSSKSGAADVLATLGVKLDIPPEAIGRAVGEVGVGFMFAAAHHAAMRHVGPSRVELGTRTIYNLLGPLSNPAGVKRQLVGVFARAWVEPIAKVLGELGSEAATVVHGSDGMDEITAAGRTWVSRLEKGVVTSFEISPDDAGLPHHPTGAVTGGDAAFNAAALRRLLEGERGAYRDTVLMNAAAALMVADRAADLREGVARAAEAIDAGRAAAVLDALVAFTNAV